jgi:hypothetical protein
MRFGKLSEDVASQLRSSISSMISFDIARIIKGTITKPTWLEVASLIVIGGLFVLVVLLLR